MGAVMVMKKLVELVENLGVIDPEFTIYAQEPWTCDSMAMAVQEPEGGGVPLEAANAGMSYLIEVFIAKEFLDGWARNEGREPTSQEMCNRLIHYAIYDA